MNAKPNWRWRSRVLAAAFVALIVLGAAGGWRWYKWRQFFEPAALLSRFPAEDAAVVSVDAALLRRAGLLSASKIALEPEYKQFLEETGFDFRRDLDHVTAAFGPSGTSFIARGRFDWAKLRAYATQHGGSCYEQLCRLQGSTAERHISFLPLRSDALGLAVSTDDLAASKLSKAGQPVAAALPAAPVWASVPGSVLRREGALPMGLRVMFSGLINADRAVFTVDPSPTGIEARLVASLRNVDDARTLLGQLKTSTSSLKQELATNATVRTDELARVLAGGTFRQDDRKVEGRWVLAQNALQALMAGI